MATNPSSISWDDVIKKEARGATDDANFGEVQEVGQNYIMTQKGVVSKDQFYIPKYLVRGYDGHTLWFDATGSQIDTFKRDSAPVYSDYARYRKPEMPSDIETRIPVIEERLNVSKTMQTNEATITKEPVTDPHC